MRRKLSEPRSPEQVAADEQRLAEMLAAGRAPGSIVRGSVWRDPIKVTAPPERMVSDQALRARQRSQTREFQRKQRMVKALKPYRKEKIGGLAASMPIESFMAMQRTMGDDWNDPGARERALRESGAMLND
jgi:hypothetical protein